MVKVLILDDDKNFCESLANSLMVMEEDKDYIVIPTTGINDALNQATQAKQSGNPFNIFLIDQRLGPEQDGIEVMQILRQLNPESDAIIFTGWENPEDGLKAYQAGAFRYLPKPFKIKELILLIHSINQWRTVQRERDRLQVLNEIAEETLRYLTFSKSAQVLTEGSLRLGFERARLFRFTQDYPTVLIGLCQAGKNKVKNFEGFILSINEDTYLSKIIKNRNAYFIKGHEGNLRLIKEVFSTFTPPAGDWVLLPLWIGEQFVGAMVLDNSVNDREIIEEDLRQLNLFGRIVAGNLERTRLYEQEKSNRQKVEDIAIQEQENTRRLDLLQHASVELLNNANQDEEKLWHILLTLATANYALGFNRAWIFLAERGNTLLRGKFGMGHIDLERARKDWERDVEEKISFENFITQLGNGVIRRTPLEDLTRDLVIELDNTDTVFLEVLNSGRRFVLQEHELKNKIPEQFNTLFTPSTCAILPFRAGKTPIGLVIVDNKFDEKPIQESSLDRLETILNMAGLVWQNLNQRKQREVLLEATYLIMGNVSQLPLGDMLQRICEAARTVIGADWSIIYPLVPGGEPYTYNAKNIGYAGKFDLTPMKSNKLRQKGVSAHILRSGTLVVNDLFNDEQPLEIKKLAEHKFIQRNGIRALIGTPIRSLDKDEKLGIFYLDFRTAKTFTPQDVLQAESFSNLAAIVISNVQRAEQAFHDLDEALSIGKASQSELEIIKRVLEGALVSTSEYGIVKTLLTNTRELLNWREINPEITLRSWKAASLDEPMEVYVRYTISPEGSIGKSIIQSAEDKKFEQDLSKEQYQASEGKLSVPIRLVESTIGAISVDLDQADITMNLPVLRRFASVAALSLDNVRRQEHLISVLAAAQALTSQVKLKQTFDTIVEVVRQVSPDLSVLTLWYRDPESKNVKCGIRFGVWNTAELERENPIPGSIVWEVIHAPEPIWASKLDKQHMFVRRFVQEEKIISVAAFPLRANNDVIGAMFFNYREEHFFTDEEKTIFKILAEVVASSIRDAVHLEQVHKEHSRLEAALKIAEAIESTKNLRQFLQKILSIICGCFPSAAPLLLLYNDDDRILSFAPATLDFYPIDNPKYLGLNSLPLNGSSIACRLARESLEEKQIWTKNIPNVLKDKDYLPLLSHTRSELCTSLVSGEGLLGILVLERSKMNGFDPEDEAFVKFIAQQISLAIERVQNITQLEFTSTVAAATAWAADLAHDINREVGAIRNYAYLIQEKNQNPDEVFRYAQAVEESATRLASAGPWHIPEPHSIIFDAFLKQWVDEYAKIRNITVEYDLHCKDISILTNPTALQRILRQLVRNAAQAMEKSDERRLDIRTARIEGNMLEIQIEDHGPGIDEKIRPLIFQQPVSTKSGHGGYGLLLIRQQIELLNGKIRLLPSQPNRGAIFSIKLLCTQSISASSET